MAMAVVRADIVSVLPVDDLCNHCFLPGLAVVTFAIWNDPRSVAPAKLSSRTACLECGEPQ